MSNLFRKDVSVLRSDGAYVEGTWVPEAPETFTVQASIQPATSEDMQSLPEGRRLKGAYKLFTDSVLYTVEEDQRNPDVVQLYGHSYEVAQVAVWQNGIVPHYRYLVTRVEVQ